MSKIKKFLDFITGYTSFSNKLNRMVNRDRQVDIPIPNTNTLSVEEILELYSLIKDYVSPVGDITGVELQWKTAKIGPNCVEMPNIAIRGLDSFMVYATLILSKDVDFHVLESEIESAKSQLESEDFILECEIRSSRSAILTIKHRSYIQPVQKRMRRAA